MAGTYITSPKKKKICKTLIILGIVISLAAVIACSVTNAATWSIALAAIGGIFSGANSFYVGRWKRGFVYFITYGILFVGAIIDLIAVSAGKFKDSNGYVIID